MHDSMLYKLNEEVEEVETTVIPLVDRAQILADLALNNPLNTTDLTVLSVWCGVN